MNQVEMTVALIIVAIWLLANNIIFLYMLGKLTKRVDELEDDLDHLYSWKKKVNHALGSRRKESDTI